MEWVETTTRGVVSRQLTPRGRMGAAGAAKLLDSIDLSSFGWFLDDRVI